MDADIKRQWVEALRSGKYQQGAGQLRQYDTYCCLGVLCDVLNEPWFPHECGGGVYGVRYGDGLRVLETSSLPRRIVESLGLDRVPNEDGYDDVVAKLIDLNDTSNPFSVIADYIDEKL